MQHALSMRGMYGAPKPKNVATVSPVIADGDHEDDDLEIPSEPHDDDDGDAQLQTKSSLRPSGSSSTLRFPFVGRISNQEDADAASASAGKYAVVGQKQQWRRTRSQRGTATIRHVSEDDLDGNGETRDELGERASSYLSTARSERADVPALAWASTTPAASARSSGRSSSLDYSARSGFSSGRQSSLSDEGTPRELFSITRQKKSRFAAKLCMPGQNPLYLGRYRSEEAARAACEEAFATITTPRK